MNLFNKIYLEHQKAPSMVITVVEVLEIAHLKIFLQENKTYFEILKWKLTASKFVWSV